MQHLYFWKVGIVAIFIAFVKRTPSWDQDHVDADEEIPTIYYDPDDLLKGNTCFHAK